MQTLDELIRRTCWAEIEAALLDCYSQEAEQVDGFRPVWERLNSLRPSPSALELRFERHEDSCGEWLSVFGKDGSLRPDGEPEGFALEYMPWSEWLGIAVPDELGRAFAEPEIVAHCLYEMTTVAFEEDAIRAQREEIERRARRWEEMTPEEREEHSVPWEEVKARIEGTLAHRRREEPAGKDRRRE